MRTRPLGKSGIEASVIGLGTWAVGGTYWGGTDEAAAVAGIQAGIDEGINLIDTAPAYGHGLSEEIVGRAIKDRRDKVVLATKCGLVWDANARREDTPPIEKDLSPASIRREIEASLRRLSTDHVDLYQTHWPDTNTKTPIADTMAALLDLKRQGKIRAIGVSNVTPEQLAEYQRIGPVDTDQEQYSMLDRQHEAKLIPRLRETGVAFLAYSPLALGLLSGKVTEEREFPEGDLRKNNPRFSKENRRKVVEMLEEFLTLADPKGITLTQLAILWTIAQPGVTHALVGARNPEQAKENASAGDEKLTQYDLAELTEAMTKHLPGIK